MGRAFAKIKTLFKGSKYTVAVVVLCCTAAVLTGCFFAYAASYDKILPNVYVEGFDVSRMDKLDAAKELRSAFALGVLDKNVVFECDGSEKTVALDDLKVAVDENKTAENAFEAGRDGGFVKKTAKLLLAVFKKTEVPLEVSVDEAKLEELILELAAGKEVEPESAGYSIDGKQLTLKKGHGGRKVDRKKAIAGIQKAVATAKFDKILLAVEEIKAEKVDVNKIYEELVAPAKDAEYKYENGEVKIVDEKVKVIVDKQKIQQAFEGDTEGMTLTVETETPKMTAAQLKEMLFRDRLGTFSSSFAASTAARASNVTLTAQRINGYILMPGDVFSYDKTIGRRTVANGFREAGVYVGNKVESGIGGGICQTSSTLYSAALYANLEIVSRTSHSLPVSYVPAGMDATIAEGYIDLKIRNNTEYPVKIEAIVNGRKITCSILGVSVPGQTVELIHSTISTSQPQTERTEDAAIPKGYKQIINKGAPGYTVASNRIVKMNGEIVKTEKLTRSVYRAAPIEEVVNPADKDTPSESLKVYTPGMKIPEPVEEPKPQPDIKDTPPEETVAPPAEPLPEEPVKPEVPAEPDVQQEIQEQTITD